MNSPEARIYLVRHAESVANINDHLIGGRSNESPLSAQGVEQAKVLGKFMLRRSILPDYVYVSPAMRTLQTAAISLSAAGLVIEPIIEDSLQELSQGEWTGLNRHDVYTPDVLAEIAAQGKDFKAAGGESMNEVGQRMHDALSDIAEQHETDDETKTPVIYVYTHGVAIRCFASFVRKWSHEKTYKTVTPNTSITYFTRDAGEWEMQFLGHQPIE